MSDKSLVSIFSQAPAATQNTFASENFNTVLYTGNGGTQRIGGYINRGAVFNGSSSYLAIDDSTDLQLAGTDYSISFWFNANNVSHLGRLINKDDGTDFSGGYFIMLNTNATLTIGHNDGSNNQNWNPSNTFSANTWYHIIVTYSDSSNLRTLYIDGSSAATIATSTNIAASSDKLFFGTYGANSASGQYFNGKLDQVRIFNKALSSSEVTTLYGETHASTTISTTDIFDDGSGVALYQLDGNANDTGGVSGKYGSAAIFNGSSSKIVADYHDGNSGSFSFWLNVADYDSSAGRQGIISTGSGSNTSLRFVIYDDDKFYWQYGDSGDAISFAQSNVTENTWVHIVATYTTTQLEVYVNNSSVASGTKSAKTFSHGNLQIGNDEANYTWFLDGRVDDLRIYSDVLTSAEVGYIYNNTTASIPTDNLTAHYKFDGDARDETTSPSYDGVASNIKYAYDGTASNVTYQEATKFTPDLVITKSRSFAEKANVFDSVRGATNRIYTAGTHAEAAQSNSLTSFDEGGFSIGSWSDINTNNATYVSWCFNAGTAAAASNTDGSITSTVKANTEAGFSIVKWTGNGTSGQSIGHGLSQAPEMIIQKRTNIAGDWECYHKDIGATKKIVLNSTAASTTSTAFGNTAPTDSVSYAGAYTNNLINYYFHSVDGYQKVGSYTGTGVANTAIAETGFEPAFVMIKRTDAGSSNWFIYDNKRDTNPNGTYLLPNASNAENNLDSYSLNFTSDGFTVNSTDVQLNANNGTYIYLAIAADPDETTPTVENSFDVALYSYKSPSATVEFDFKPDLIWIKSRNAYGNYLFDTVRGIDTPNDSYISTNSTAAEVANTDRFSFSEDGRTMTIPTGSNAFNSSAGANYVAWCWKAGDHDDSLPEINTNGSIDSTVSVNDAAGFSIVKYTGNLTASTVGHGLSSAPELIIVKRTDSTSNWFVYSLPTGNTKYLNLDSTGVATTFNVWNNTSPTSNVFSLAAQGDVNASGGDYIAYCWYSVSGHSKIGSYNGSGAAGNAQNIGFAPRWLMVKRYSGSASNWVIFDTQRTDGSGAKALYADLSNAEGTDGRVNLTSTGFDFDGSAFNESSTSWIYMAFK